jgi:predicted acyltransferase
MATAVETLPLGGTPDAAPRKTARLLSLDAFRGFTMILLISHGFGFHEAFKDWPGLQWLSFQTEHAEWAGCTVWDLIQPAFTFIVGVAMPLAFLRRRDVENKSIWKHVLWRALMLLVLSNVLSNWNTSQPPKLQFINVLCQIAFSYVLCFAIMQLRFAWQVAAAAAVMVFHHALFYAFPGPSGPFDQAGNIGAVIDLAVLGYNYSGYYTTINFLGNAITVLFGVWTGMLVASDRTHQEKMRILLGCAAGAFALGLALSPWIPMVKRLWLGSFTFFSAGWVLLLFATFYWIIEMRKRTSWTFPLVVVGVNCIFIYSFAQVLRGWLARGIGNFTGNFAFLGPIGAIPLNLCVLAAMWGLCYWLYRRKIIFKI